MDVSTNLHWTDPMQESDSIREKRRHPRFYLNLPIEFTVMDAPSVHGAIIINVSETGLLIQSHNNLSVGTRLNIAVLFTKEFELANFEVSAEVVWIKIYSEERQKMYHLGIRFIKISEENRKELKYLLSNCQ